MKWLTRFPSSQKNIDCVAWRCPRSGHRGSQDFQTNAIVGIRVDLTDAGEKSNAYPNHPGQQMRQLSLFSERLLRFTSSQKSVDRLTIWLAGTVSALSIVVTVVFVIFMLLR